MSNQEPVPHNIEQLVTVIQVGALPSRMRVHGYPCVSHRILVLMQQGA